MTRPATRAARASQPPPPPAWSVLLGRGYARRSFALLGGVVLHATGLFVTATTLPSVVADVGGLALYAWTTTLFVVASILGSAVVPSIIVRVGARVAYGGATAAFAVGASVCAGAQSMPALVLGRAVQGFGGGLLLALSYAMIQRLLPAPLWGRAVALVSGMWGVATLLGPAIGGIFAEHHAWRWAFGCLVPMAAVGALVAIPVLPATPPRWRGAPHDDAGRVPLPQLVLLSGAVVAASLGSVSRGPWTTASALAVAGLLAAAGAIERRTARRLLPRGALDRSGPLLPRYAALSLLAVAVTSSEVFVPLLLQRLHGSSPLAAGFLGALMAVGWALGSLGASAAAASHARRLAEGGPALAAAGMAALAVLVPATPHVRLQLPGIAAGLVAAGGGVGLCWPYLLSGVLAAARPGDRDQAAASLTTVQLITGALGAAAAGAVVNAAGLDAVDATVGARHAARWLFGLLAIGPAAALLAVRRLRRHSGDEC